MGDTKSVAGETDVPSGLDVVPMEPGTIVGSRDQQGTDGTTRTDRPGEILGTPVATDARTDARRREAQRSDYITSEVDRANREELPRLGGTVDDGWQPGDATPSEEAQAASDATAARTGRAQGVTTTDIAPASNRTTDSGMRVSPKIDRG